MTEFLKYGSWYKDSHAKLKTKYGADIQLIAGLIASCSPQTPLHRNLLVAESIYTDFKASPEAFLKLLKNKTKFYRKYGLFKPHYNNIKKVVFCQYFPGLKLSGNKVNSFYQNLIGNYNAVTIDSWMCQYFKIENNHIPKAIYEKLAEVIRASAKKLELFPAELQAIIWTKTRAEAGELPLSFSDLLN
jgi:hypothetical protein